MSENKELLTAFVSAQSEITAAIKDKKNPHFKSTYADISSVIEAIQPAFTKHKLAFMQPISSEDGKWVMETILIHASGQTMSLGRVQIIVKELSNPQSFKSSVTYFRRTAMLSAFGISEEDDDGNEAAKPKEEPKPVQSPYVKPFPPPQPEKAKASVKNQKRLFATANDIGLDIEGLRGLILGLYGFKSTKDLSDSQINELCDLMMENRDDHSYLVSLAKDAAMKRGDIPAQ